ncbi:protein of unknown function DUF115 [Caldicellulosiruptor obsidiansis OB47]|uniref:6-hydroxymethylpterin diphosphokinase MptE-like domain-containing protein n=1 Tax=Caldicellulosiruptor obsidiansis (strain ATCC BAA-2073 / JCM 16842 / OB47) TaxID=608506 RepID=D9TJP9_CALOO|nr:6-hydroxymethylpterin diphosphokinase MptE-like protein [Caldicellulosiruptor obsidiansis]ADL42231.1 protein of unknown function DUF115 [Caldicellulosiruptor obsidiansis OB47]
MNTANVKLVNDIAKDGSIILKLIAHNKVYYLSSKYNPIEDAKKWADCLAPKKEGLNVIIGIGNVYLIKEILTRIGEEGRLIIIEPFINVLISLMETLDISDILNDRRVILILYNDLDELEEILYNYINWSEIGKIKFFALPNYEKILGENYRSIIQVINKAIKRKQLDINTLKQFDKIWFKNLLENLYYVFRSGEISNFVHAFKDVPVIIVSAGPSLNKNIHLLKDVKGKAIIITGGRTLRLLLENEIVPDFIVTIDGSYRNYEFFEGIEYSHIPLIYTPNANANILQNYRGKYKILVNNVPFLDRIFKKYGVETGFLPGGGSVACFAFEIATKIFNCSPIIFVGQDLAFTNGFRHAVGANDAMNEVSLKDNPNLLFVDGVNGDKVLTDFVLYDFLKWFEKNILYDNSGRVYINATEGGAHIKGTIPMKLADVINEYLSERDAVEIEVRKSKFFKDFKTLDEKFEDFKYSFISELKTIKYEFEEILQKVNRAIELNKKILEDYNEKFLDELDLIDKYLLEKFQENKIIDDILMTVSYKVLNYDIDCETEEEIKTKVVEKGNILYKGLKEAIEFALPLLSDSINKLNKSRDN